MSGTAKHPPEVYDLLHRIIADGEAFHLTQDDAQLNCPTGQPIWIRYGLDNGLLDWHREAGNLYVLGATDAGGLAYELWKRAGAGGMAAPANNRGKNVNARMRKTMEQNPEAEGWSLRQWAEHLDCAAESVHDTDTWEEIMIKREADRFARKLRQNKH